MRRGEDDPVGLECGNRSQQFAFDVIVVSIDQLEDHPVAVLGAFEHASH